MNVNRFPGGAAYNINENSQGSDVKVNVEMSPSGRRAQKVGDFSGLPNSGSMKTRLWGQI